MATETAPGLSPNWKCPLNEGHCQQLTQALQTCADLECYLNQLAQIGMPVEQWMSEVATLKTMAAGLKAAHFPNEA